MPKILEKKENCDILIIGKIVKIYKKEKCSNEKIKNLKTAIEYFDEVIFAEVPSRYVLENIIDTIWIYSNKTVKFDLKVDIEKLI